MVSDVNELTPNIEDYDLPEGRLAKFSSLDYSLNCLKTVEHVNGWSPY